MHKNFHNNRKLNTVTREIYILDNVNYGLKQGIEYKYMYKNTYSSCTVLLDYIKLLIIHRYTEGEIHFNLMALVSDRKMIYERQMEELIRETQMLGMETDETEKEIRRLKMLIEYEDAKMLRYRQEMARRRHNYLPFIITLLKILAEEKKLMPLYEKAKERALKKGQKKLKV